MSPWKSDKQRKACYATHGWGGKVDCKKYGSDTKGNRAKKQVNSPKNKKR